jgi:hypothetical protein
MAEPGESTLPDTLGTVPRLLEGFGRQRTPESRGQFAREQMPALFRGGAEADAQAKMGAFERDQEKIRKEAEAEREVVRGTRLESQKLDTGLQERGTFEAPEYKASDYAANSATRLLTAVLLGGVARTSARGQLEAIKAMQDAEEQGLRENFVAARSRFDEQEKARVDNNKMLKDRFDRMIDLLSKDRNAALIEAKLIEGNLGKGIIAAELRAGNYTKAYDLFNKAIEAGDKTALEKFKATTSARAAAAKAAGGQMGTPGFSEQIVLHPSGVPLAQINIYEGLSGKDLADTRKSEAELAKPVRQELVKETQKARKTQTDMDIAESALKNIERKGGLPTGGIYGMPGVGGVMQDIRTSFDPDASRFKTIASQMQRDAYVPGEGQISNYERQLFAQSNIDLGRPSETNYALIEAYRVAAERTLERAEFFDRYFAVNRTLSGADTLWEQYIENNPVIMLNEQGEIVKNPNRAKSYVEYFRGIAGQSGGRGSQQAQSQPSGGAKTATMEDIRFTAQQRNMSVDEVLNEARQQGFTIQD